MFPKPIQNLIEQFEKLPGVGPKTAERYVLYLLKKSQKTILEFAQSLVAVNKEIITCQTCHAPSQNNPCYRCNDNTRDSQILCIVAQYQDMLSIEHTGGYNGHYHVLGGTLNALEGRNVNSLKIQSLVQRLQQNKPVEIILAIDPSIEGEVTVMYLIRLLKQFKGIKLTRLAQGLPMGGHIEYADEITIKNALNGRQRL